LAKGTRREDICQRHARYRADRAAYPSCTWVAAAQEAAKRREIERIARHAIPNSGGMSRGLKDPETRDDFPRAKTADDAGAVLRAKRLAYLSSGDKLGDTESKAEPGEALADGAGFHDISPESEG
jgi:hypothetical protein